MRTNLQVIFPFNSAEK